MNSKVKSLLFNRYSIWLITAFLISYGGYGQATFLTEIKASHVYDVFEDDKGCLIASTREGITRINPSGNILWQRKGGSLLFGEALKDSQYYLFSARSSEFGGFGMAAYDYKGKELWSVYHSTQPVARSIWDFMVDTARRQNIVVGMKHEPGGSNKLYYWIAGVDFRGNIQWENIWRDSGRNRIITRVVKNTKTKGYYLLTVDENDSRNQELLNVDTLGRLLNRNFVEPNPCHKLSIFDYNLKDIIPYNDSLCLATVDFGYSQFCSQGNGWYYYFYNSRGEMVKKIRKEWVSTLVIQTHDKGILFGGGTSIAKLNKELELEWSSKLYPQENNQSVEIIKIAQSRDGGYYGIAHGYKNVDHPIIRYYYFAYVFKTDSLGQIHQQKEYSEKTQSMMLQPNPAQNTVRIAIPYYHGTIKARFYDIFGVFLFEQIGNERDYFDIGHLSSGMYRVEALIEETGEMRSMKLMIQ